MTGSSRSAFYSMVVLSGMSLIAVLWLARRDFCPLSSRLIFAAPFLPFFFFFLGLATGPDAWRERSNPSAALFYREAKFKSLLLICCGSDSIAAYSTSRLSCSIWRSFSSRAARLISSSISAYSSSSYLSCKTCLSKFSCLDCKLGFKNRDLINCKISFLSVCSRILISSHLPKKPGRSSIPFDK